ncbi:MAG: LytTR family transcriptional regulator DNA-binding domain-containing protein [Clostridium sp.]|nr:LytTR family transcriptional regulator DNA-binding domain-containing protein [Clostridium sp.]
MKKYRQYTEEEVIEKTRKHLHDFYERKMEPVTDNMTKDFVWIGAYEFQWGKSLEDFKKATIAESKEPSVRLSEEEFHILTQDRHTWVVYGRFSADALSAEGTLLHALVRVTYIWRQFKDDLKVIHIHCSHAQDVPLTLPAAATESFFGDTGFFDYMREIDFKAVNTRKLQFRDRQSNHHFLFPSEVLYLKACRQWCTVFTQNGSFDVRGGISDFEEKLSEHFLRIHKSYLVNIRHIDVVRRYNAVLRNGETLPISKDRYMSIKEFLKSSKV